MVRDVLWVECHERMIRWFVMMDHYMQSHSGTADETGKDLVTNYMDFCMLSSFLTFYNFVSHEIG